MADPVTIGTLAAAALAIAAEAALKGGVGEAVKDAYAALKSWIGKWAEHDVKALESSPGSSARKAVLAEAIDTLKEDDALTVRKLAEELVTALRSDAASTAIGLDISTLEALKVQLGDITVSGGIAARIGHAKVEGEFKTGDIRVTQPRGKR
jgi:hypothetical protein